MTRNTGLISSLIDKKSSKPETNREKIQGKKRIYDKNNN